MRLRTHLLLSYALVIVVTLGLIGAALFVFISSRPAPVEFAYRDLLAYAQIASRDLLADQPPRRLRALDPALRDEQVAALASETVRALLVDLDAGQVLFDSAGHIAPGQLVPWELDTIQTERVMRANAAGMLRDRLQFYAGDFVEAGEQRWLFVGLGFQTMRDTGTAVFFAQEQPNLSLRESLLIFGDELLRPLLQAACVGVAAAVVMAALITRAIAGPLQRIAGAAGAIAGGDYDAQAPVAGPAEVRALASAFNDMAHQVRATQQTQRDFLVNVSHDLKTPLTSIQGYSQAIIDGAAPDPVEAAGIIHEEAARLNRLVVQLTDLARLQSGQLVMQRTPLDVGQILTAVGQKLRIVAEREGVTLTVDAAPLPVVHGDGDRLAQVITNLLSNAIKYTPSGGRVWAHAGVNHGGVELMVQDTGIGIPPQDLDRVFERFYQVDKARGPRRGTGLGLAIVREIVTAHGGRISVTSAGANQGATFTVWLPAPAVHAARG